MPKYLIQTSTGRWRFVGRVDARLIWMEKDGSVPTEDRILSAIRASGPGFVGLVSRSFASKEEAEAFEASLPA